MKKYQKVLMLSAVVLATTQGVIAGASEILVNNSTLGSSEVISESSVEGTDTSTETSSEGEMGTDDNGVSEESPEQTETDSSSIEGSIEQSTAKSKDEAPLTTSEQVENKSVETEAKAAKQYVTVYRLYNRANKEHLYTTDKNEMTTLLKLRNTDWKYEGPQWMSPKNVGTKVFRVYNPKSGEHIYTKDTYEVKVLKSKGWRDEGVKFYSDTSGKPVYRLFNPAAGIGAHFVTPDAYEKSQLVKGGWKYEGEAWKRSNVKLVNDYTPPKPTTPAIKAPTYFSQLDSRWANVKLNSSTVGPWGCVPTSLAMILKGSYGLNVDPGTVALKADPLSNQAYGLSGKDLVKTTKAYGKTAEVISDKNTAIARLKAGYPIIFYINIGVGHSVVVWGYNNGTVNVNDPAARRYYPTGRTTLNELWGRPSPDAMDWDAGRPVFAIK